MTRQAEQRGEDVPAGGRRRWSPLWRWWEGRKRRAFPPGALTFQLALGSEERLRDGLPEALDLMGRLELDELLLLHGTALETARGAVVVCGPPGIGKSTVARRLVRGGRARLLEDGVVVAGLKRGGMVVIETGTLEVLARMSKLSGALRRVTGLRRSAHSRAPTALGRAQDLFCRRLVDPLTWRLAILLSRAREGFRVREIHLAGLVLAEPHAGHVPHRVILRDGTVGGWECGTLGVGVPVVRVGYRGRRREVERALEEAILGLMK